MTTSASPAASASARALPVFSSGTYVLWQKSARMVFFVRNGRLVHEAKTTGNLAKTPPGTYHIQYRLNPGSETDGHTRYLLWYFQDFGPVPHHEGIGFHEVPVTTTHTYIQPLSTVGTPGYQSDGCLRLLPADALYAWKFLHIGSTVKVIA